MDTPNIVQSQFLPVPDLQYQIQQDPSALDAGKVVVVVVIVRPNCYQ
jgi:hypothetical protein